MANLPSFHHIHCSSRFDRSAASLDADITDWQTKSSLITLTEVEDDHRASQLRAQGWGYYACKLGPYAADGAIGWDTTKWKQLHGAVRKLSKHTYMRAYSKRVTYIYSVTAVLKRVDTGHKLLVSVAHFPAHIEGQNGWRTDLEKWKARKATYLDALGGWSNHVNDQVRKQHVDAALLVADWNLDLKENWVRSTIMDHWGPSWHLAWQAFPTSGGSMHGGPVAPLGAPGVSKGDRIIDGSLYQGLKVDTPPNLMARVSSSDHRPYQERFTFADKAENPITAPASGDIKHGDAWWGFGDYMTDEIYPTPAATGDAGGEVL
jgi:hypothetical protein